jgi:hypothetical protein
VKHEGPNQILNLSLNDQNKKIIFGEILDLKDYENWIRCVSKEEDVQKVARYVKQLEECPLIL